MSLEEKRAGTANEADLSKRRSDLLIKRGYNGVSLLPYPSDDPNDPLVSIAIRLFKSLKGTHQC
jgi:hypothetical protein